MFFFRIIIWTGFTMHNFFFSILGVRRARGRRYHFPTCSVLCWQIFILCSDTENSTSTPWCCVFITRNKIKAVSNLNDRCFNILHRLFSDDERYHGTFLHEMRLSIYSYRFHYHPHWPLYLILCHFPLEMLLNDAEYE